MQYSALGRNKKKMSNKKERLIEMKIQDSTQLCTQFNCHFFFLFEPVKNAREKYFIFL